MPALGGFGAAVGAMVVPVRRHFLYAILEDPKHGPKTEASNTVLAKALYSGLACIPLLATCYLFWRRIKEVRWQTINKVSYIRCLVYSSYILSIAFFITSLIISGIGIHTAAFCQTTINFCIGFLMSGRFTIQLFLVERAHIANLDYLRRRDDPMWLISTSLVLAFGTFVTLWAYLNPVAYIANSDGLCRKGIPPEVVAPLEVYECVSYILLTGVFVVMLRRTRQTELFPRVPQRFTTFGKALKRLVDVLNPAAAKKVMVKNSAMTKKTVVETVELGDEPVIVLPASTQPCKLRGLVYKSLIGTVLILGWGVINSSIFYVTGGKEHVWLCFAQCNMDLFLSVCVLHWLTANPKEFELALRATRLSVTELPMFLQEGPDDPEKGDSVVAVPLPAKRSSVSVTVTASSSSA